MASFEVAPVENYLGLGGLIARLEREDPARVLPLGFANPHSFRGDYMDLAFEPVANVSIGDMLAAARSALGATYEGWKGGDFTMHEHSSCWIAERGDGSDNQIGPLLLDLMLARAHGVEDERADVEFVSTPAEQHAREQAVIAAATAYREACRELDWRAEIQPRFDALVQIRATVDALQAATR